MHRSIRTVSLVAVIATLVASPALAEVLPQDLKIEKVLDTSATLGDLAQSPTGELWVLERGGTVRVFVAGVEDASLAIPVSTAGDGGLLDVAFDPAYAAGGRALVSYVDASGRLRIDEVLRSPGALTLGALVVDLGVPASGLRPGGGLEVGKDGKLYVATGDFGSGANAQDDGSLAGKMLRYELDGSIPADNPSGTAVWAKGFRDGTDLALNPASTRPEGTLYLADLGVASTAEDEIDAVAGGGNYGWDQHSGAGGGFVDPLVSHTPTVGVGATVSLAATALGEAVEGDLLYACTIADDVERIDLTGADADQVVGSGPFYDPDGDRDGTPDALCPTGIHALEQAGDGQVYAAADGANPGIWRIWRDAPGAREVSPAGSPFPLTVDKNGSDLTLGWESLGDLDVGRPARNGGQHATKYSVWEGSLPLDGTYDHVRVLDTDGLADGPARLTASVAPGSGSRYYLVTAQGDNMEGPAGAGRPAAEDWCDTIGWGIGIGDCAERWVDPLAPSQELCLVDKNPNSPTFDRCLTMSDFRGKVVRMDISSDNCFWCNVQSGYLPAVERKYRDRDFRIVTVFTQTYAGVIPFATIEGCATAAAAWAGTDDDAPILCDVDRNGDGHGDVSWQYWHSGSYPVPEDCGGTPQNFYIDQGGVMYDFVCGAELSSTGIEAAIAAEVNPETCE